MGWKKSCVGLAVAGVFGSTILHSQLLAAGRRTVPAGSIPSVVTASHVSGQSGTGDDQDQTMRRIQSRLRARYGYGPAEVEQATKEATQRPAATYSVRPQQRAGTVVQKAPPKPQQGLLDGYKVNAANPVARQSIDKPVTTENATQLPRVSETTSQNVVQSTPIVPSRGPMIETVPVHAVPQPTAAPERSVEVATKPLPVAPPKSEPAPLPATAKHPLPPATAKRVESPPAAVATKSPTTKAPAGTDWEAVPSAKEVTQPKNPVSLPTTASTQGSSRKQESSTTSSVLAAPKVMAPPAAVVNVEPAKPPREASTPTGSTWRGAKEAHLAANRARQRSEGSPSVTGYEKGQVSLPRVPVSRDPNTAAEEQAGKAAKIATEDYATKVSSGYRRAEGLNTKESVPASPAPQAPLAAKKPSELPSVANPRTTAPVTPVPAVSNAAIAMAKKHMDSNNSSPIGLSFVIERVKQGALLEEGSDAPAVASKNVPPVPTPIASAPLPSPIPPEAARSQPAPAVAGASESTPKPTNLPPPPALPSAVAKSESGSVAETTKPVARDTATSDPTKSNVAAIPSLPAMGIAKDRPKDTEQPTSIAAKENLATTKPVTVTTAKPTNSDTKLPVSPFLKQGSPLPPVNKESVTATSKPSTPVEPSPTITVAQDSQNPSGRSNAGKPKAPAASAPIPTRKSDPVAATTPTQIPVAPIRPTMAANQSKSAVPAPVLAPSASSPASNTAPIPSLPDPTPTEVKNAQPQENLLAKASTPTQVTVRKPVMESAPPKLPAPSSGPQFPSTTPASKTTASVLEGGNKPKSPSTVPLQPLAAAPQYLKPHDPVMLQHNLDTLRRGGSEIERQKALKSVAQMSDWQDAAGVGAVLRNIAMTDYNTHMRLSAVQMLGSMKNDRRMVMEALHISAEYDSDLTIRRTATQLLDRLASLPANETIRR